MHVVSYRIVYVEGSLAGQSRTASEAFDKRCAAERYAKMLRGYAANQQIRRGVVASFRVSDVRVEHDTPNDGE